MSQKPHTQLLKTILPDFYYLRSMLRARLFVGFFISILHLGAQESKTPVGNLWMLHAAGMLSPKTMIDDASSFPVWVDAPYSELEMWCAQGHALYNGYRSGRHRLVVTPIALRLLLQQPWLVHVEWQGGKGLPLSDTSKIHARTWRIHRGDTLLPRAYTGKGVVLGFVDTGIDFLHPDFSDTNGRTRIRAIWDQTRHTDTNRRPHFGYGEVYRSVDIDSGNCPHIDPNTYSGHGTMVAGIAAGNGRSVPDSIADYSGHAPEAQIVMVASDFGNNWLQTVADGVAFIFEEADRLGLPAVVNLSLGTYLGSHDGLDPAAQYIDSLLLEKPGRAVVAAVGNAGAMSPFHLRTLLSSDTAITRFAVNPSSGVGGAAVFFELWADTSAFSNVRFAILETDTLLRDTLYPRSKISSRLNVLHTDTLLGNARYMTWSEVQGDKYLLQVLVLQPRTDVSYAFWSEGHGAFDIWSANWLGLSDIVVNNLPNIAQYPLMRHYKFPDSLQSMVSSWACSPNVITVANFNNRYAYLNTEGNLRLSTDLPVGAKGLTSSLGPNRKGYNKPDVAAPGNFTLAPGRITDINFLQNTASVRYKLAVGGFHFSNGGSSMAAPVVAGIAALMLERCPSRDATQLAAEIRKSAYSDMYTGVVPNFMFGYGKIDGLAAITQPRYGIALGATTEEACLGDSVIVQPVGTFDRIIWHTSDTLSRFISLLNDTINARTIDSSGCEFFTDTIIIYRHELPTVRILGDSLICKGKNGVLMVSEQWPQVVWSTNEYFSSITINDTGWYGVEVRDSNQCHGTDSIHISFKACVNVGEGTTELPADISVFPQPASYTVNIAIQHPNGPPYTLELLSLQGATLSSFQITESHFTLPVGRLPTGTYLLQVSQSGNSVFQRRILVH